MWTDILLDLDGTLTDSGEGILGGATHALEALGLPVPPREVLRGFVGPPLEVSFQQFCGLSGQVLGRAVELYRQYYREKGMFQHAPYPGVDALLAALANAGRRLHLATAKPLEPALPMLEQCGLKGYFSSFSGNHIGKPALAKDQVIRLALEAAAPAPGAAVMVGDTVYDVEGARQNGIPCVAVLYGYGPKEELAGAEYRARDVAELQALLLSH